MKKLFSVLLSVLLCANILINIPLPVMPDNIINSPAIGEEKEEQYEPNDEDPGCQGDTPR